MNVEWILERFDGVRPAGGQSWYARCPAHPDSSPSLKITRGENRILVYCHGGCAIGDVLEAAGLRWSDMYEDEQGSFFSPRKGSEPSEAEWERIWARVERDADRETEDYLQGSYRGPGGERRERMLPLERGDFDTSEQFDVYERWRQGDGRLPVLPGEWPEDRGDLEPGWEGDEDASLVGMLDHVLAGEAGARK